MGGHSQPCPRAQPVPGRAGGAWEHTGIRPQKEDPIQPRAFAVTHLPHPPKKMTQLLISRLPRTKELPLHAGGSTAAPFSRSKAKAGCHPHRRSLCPHCPPRSLLQGRMPPASSSSSGGAGGIWTVCELEEEANRAFNLWILEEGTADPPAQGRAASRTIHSQRELPNPALVVPLDTSRPNSQGSEGDRAPKPPQEGLREGKILALCTQKIPGCHSQQICSQPLQGRGRKEFPKRWHFCRLQVRWCNPLLPMENCQDHL